MPYIPQDQRDMLSDPARKPITSGQLNYRLSQEIRSYIGMKGLSYTALNDVIGVLACLSMEVYRKIAANYEDKKEQENGSVWS